MPTYEYVCEPCGVGAELYRPLAEVDEPALCPKCGLPMRRKPSTGVAGYVH